jgi:hypothetical protein
MLTMNGLRLAAAAVLLGTTTACAMWPWARDDNDMEPPRDLVIVVENQNFYDVTVYARWDAERRRIGRVVGNTTERFDLRYRIGAMLQFEVSLLAGGTFLTERMSVIYLLDQSDSIPAERQRQMLDYAITSARQHRIRAREDLAGLVVFGREASIEIPPFDEDLPPLRRLDSYLGRTDATNLEAALKIAQAAMPP